MGRAMSALEYFSDLFGGSRENKKRKQLQTVELRVRMDCEGCERKINKVLSSMSGVQTVDINRKMQKVTVTGYVEPNKVLKKVKRTGKRAELWPYVPYNSVSQPFSTQNYDKKAPSGFVRKESFNTRSYSNRQDDQYGTNMFSEENPNACTIM
uniref:HMA domain-containing protein n=1 Tax=Picea sitchensis TaxID=3332 RepID=A9NQ31_PICSI|nr:unknown [Picea sitchensis]